MSYSLEALRLEGFKSFRRPIAEADDGWAIDGEPVRTGASRRNGAGIRLSAVIRRGEVGRLLRLHSEERAHLFTTALKSHIAPSGHGRLAPGEMLSALLQGRVPAADRRLFERVVRALDDGLPNRSLRAGAAGGSESGHARFLELHARVENRFGRFFSTLVPGGEDALPVDRDEAAGNWRVRLWVRFPHRQQVPPTALSGSQLATLGLCLAPRSFPRDSLARTRARRGRAGSRRSHGAPSHLPAPHRRPGASGDPRQPAATRP